MLHRVQLFAVPWTSACQAPLHHDFQKFFKLMSIASVMPSNHLILCSPLLPPHKYYAPKASLITFPILLSISLMAHHLETREDQGCHLKLPALPHLDNGALASSTLLLFIIPFPIETDTVLGGRQAGGGSCMKGSTFLSKRY